MEKTAKISPDGIYRYTLTRRWGLSGLGTVLWVMLNPSTADADVDDPTIRRCVDFADRWGYDQIEVVNLYALRASDPAKLLTHPAPSGPENAFHVWDATTRAEIVVAAWGANKAVTRTPMAREIRATGPFCLGRTKAGHPKHPLYVSGATMLTVID